MPFVTVPTVQLYAPTPVMATFVAVPLQIVSGLTTMVGSGLTVTNTELVAVQPDPLVEVIRYCTVPTTVLLGFVNVWAIALPLPAVAPVMPFVTVPTVQLYEPTPVIATFVAVPLQIVSGFTTIVGKGFTVTKTELVTVQPSELVLVIKYCTVPTTVLLGFVNV